MNQILLHLEGDKGRSGNDNHHHRADYTQNFGFN
jgi:hypothetical protein